MIGPPLWQIVMEFYHSKRREAVTDMGVVAKHRTARYYALNFEV